MRFLYLFILIGFFSCSTKNPEEAFSKETLLTFELDSLIQEKCVGENCATLRLVWPKANGENQELINQEIQSQLTSMLMLGERFSESRDSLIADYFKVFEEFKRDFPDSYGGYELQVEAGIPYVSDSTISVKYSWMSFMGGAHPNHGVQFLNLDKNSGRALSIDRLVKDEVKLKELVEQKFRAFHEIKPEVKIEEDGRFFLPEAGFFLASAMGFQEDKFWVIYVPYEIGPYSMGYTELEFTKEELGELVRW